MEEQTTTEAAVVVQRMHDFNKWIIERSGKFPHAYKFPVDDRMVAASLGLLLPLVGCDALAASSAILEEGYFESPLGGPLRDVVRIA